MSSEFLPSPPTASPPPAYASLEEVRQAVEGLSAADAKKLQLLACLHCRAFGVPSGCLEPAELFNEAIQRSLDGRKRWRQGVGILRHLDRAMENIAGHEIVKWRRRCEVGNPHQPGKAEEEADDPFDSRQTPRSPDQTVVAQVMAREELARVAKLFEDDLPAWDVLQCRAAGQEGKEIRAQLKFSSTEYDTISKRILRKIHQHYEPTLQARRHGRAA